LQGSTVGCPELLVQLLQKMHSVLLQLQGAGRVGRAERGDNGSHVGSISEMCRTVPGLSPSTPAGRALTPM